MSAVKTNKRAKEKRKPSGFDAEYILNSAGLARTIREFRKNETLFSQGDLCKNIMYIQKGAVKISVVSESGKDGCCTTALLLPHPASTIATASPGSDKANHFKLFILITQ